jgi:hypothetical protein
MRQLISVFSHELHGLSLQALAGDLQRLDGRLGAERSRWPSQPRY